MREIGHFIGGKAVKGASGRFGDVFDPNTGEVQAKVALAKHSEVEHAIANAQAAQPAWAARAALTASRTSLRDERGTLATCAPSCEVAGSLRPDSERTNAPPR